MRLLLDQGVPADAAALLRLQGYHCMHVSELGMSRATDEEIIYRAAAEAWIVVTLDADFHSIVAVRGLSSPSVLRIREEGCRAEHIVALLIPVLVNSESRLRQGCLISIKNHRVTVRNLPVGGSREA